MSISGDYRIDALLRGDAYRWNAQFVFGTATVISYAFAEVDPAYYANSGLVTDSSDTAITFQSLDEAHRSIVRQQFATYSTAIPGLSFFEVTDPRAAVILVSGYSGAANVTYNASGFAPNGADNTLTGDIRTSGDIWLVTTNQEYDLNASQLGVSLQPNWFANVVMHELGHAIGFKHPGNYNPGMGSDAPPYLPTAEDKNTYTVMSYHGHYSGLELRPYDILAGAYLYGSSTPNTNRWLLANDGNTVIQGSALNELIVSAAASETIDGAGGKDTVRYSENRADYAVTRSSSAITVSRAGAAGVTDALSNIERIEFADQKIAFDLGVDESSGSTALLIGAVLPGQLALDASKQVLLGSVIGLFDSGYSMRDLSGALLRLPIWHDLTGLTAPSHSDIARYLLTNVYGQAPDQATLAAAVNALDTESFEGDWLAALAASAAAQTHIGLLGLAQSGLVFA